MNIGSLSLTNSSVFTVKTIGSDVYVHLIGSGTPLLCMSREEALELSCRLEQAAQKIKESEDSCKGGE